MSSKDENENEDDDEDDDETMDQNKKYIIIKGLNDDLNEIIDKSKSFEDQIKPIKKVEGLNEYDCKDFGDKELKLKYFKLKLVHFSNTTDEMLFEQIFGHTIETLANKLINTANKEENQITVNNIEKNKNKLYEDKLYEHVILIFVTQTSTGTMVKRVPQEQMFVIEATLLENHFLPSSGFALLMSVENVLIS